MKPSVVIFLTFVGLSGCTHLVYPLDEWAFDGSVDAVVPDAALPDAALPDAALPDAALPDAALPDAALPDAALPDAALPDAALPDAALPDAALPDAALPDAAPAEPCGCCMDVLFDGACVGAPLEEPSLALFTQVFECACDPDFGACPDCLFCGEDGPVDAQCEACLNNNCQAGLNSCVGDETCQAP